MPPLPNVPDVVKVQVKGTFTSGYNWANVMHFSYGGSAPSSATCAAIATQALYQYQFYMLPLMGATTSINEAIVTDLSSSSGGEGNNINDQPGTRTGGGIGANATFLISKTIFTRYRGGHPRTYLPIGLSPDLANEGHWTSGFVTSATAAWQSFIDNMIGFSSGGVSIGQECAVSYYETDYTTTPPKRIRRTTPVVYEIAVDGYRGNAEMASQRRRIGRKR